MLEDPENISHEHYINASFIDVRYLIILGFC